MEDIDEIRQKKLDELKKQQEDEQLKMQQEVQKQMVLKEILDIKARERLTRIKMANPQYAEQIEAVLFQLLQAGRIKGKINEETFKQLIRQVFGTQKKDFHIERR
ncbi:MAG: DNA-binding protein [Theionarchaea archaeon]|nr:DNA-binding protein [Theionarchaea archaeon]